MDSKLIRRQGKTTTTERMLYYSGYTRRIGGMLITAECPA